MIDPELSKEEKNQLASDIIIGFLVAEDDSNSSTDEEDEEVVDASIEEVTVQESLEDYLQTDSKENSVESQMISNILSIKEELQNQNENNSSTLMTSSNQSSLATTRLFRSHSVPQCRPKQCKRGNPTFVAAKTNQPPI